MHKTIGVLLALLCVAFSFCTPAQAITLDADQAIQELQLGSQAYYLFDLTNGELVMSKDADKVMKVASLTKIMTALVVLENRQLDEIVTITRPMISNLYDYVVAGFRVGQKVSVEDLLYALLLPSAGDAAQALAISTSGSITEFANKMNERATQLGLKNTHFSNPTGMDNDNYSTAHDIAIILQAALEDSTFKKIFETNEWNLRSINMKVEKTYKPRAHIAGGKTGYTGQAGRCFASIATIEGVDYLMVNLGANSKTSNHINDAEKIYAYIEQNFEEQTVISSGVLAQTLQVKDSFQETTDLYTETEFSDLLPADLDHAKIEYVYEGMTIITREVELGAKVGQYIAKYDGEELGRVDLFLRDEITFLNYPLIAACIVGGAVIAVAIACLIRALIRRHR